MTYYDMVDPMTGKHEQIRPLEEIASEMDALDVQIDALQKQRYDLDFEHERTAKLMGLRPRFF